MARPGLTKPECFGLLASFHLTRRYANVRAAKFLRKFPLWSFVLQAPQALETVTGYILGGPGYGILPGPIMGMVSDFFWGFIRSKPGVAVRFNGPPPADVGSKAMRFLLQTPTHQGASQAFSLEDHVLLSAATSIAAQVVASLPITPDIEERADFLFSTPVPQFTPWTESSLEIALSEGWRPDLPATDPTLPGLVDPTYGQVLQQLTLDWHDVEAELSQEHGSTTLGTVHSMLVYDAGDTIFNWLVDGEQMFEPRFSELEQVFARQFEFQIFPPDGISQLALEQYLTLAWDTAQARGAAQVGISDLQTARAQFFPDSI